MKITRRDFVKFAGISAAALGLSAADLTHLEEALANSAAPTVIWLQGAACTGCSVSFLNRISTSDPKTAADVLISSINLRYHPNIMASAGESAVAIAEDAYTKGGYVLVVEGGVPTAFNGSTCWAWSLNGQDVTFQQAVTDLASKAIGVLCVGTCASFGGIPAAPPNPTGIKSVSAATGLSTINIPGCPTHPNWIVWAIVQILTGQTIAMDTYHRPTAIFGRTVHDQCPRHGTSEATTFGQDNRCLRSLGCRGPSTKSDCPNTKWNNGVNWCIDANANCIGCTEPSFPSSSPFYT